MPVERYKNGVCAPCKRWLLGIKPRVFVDHEARHPGVPVERYENGSCKPCACALYTALYWNNREEELARNAAYRSTHREEIAAYNAAYNATHPFASIIHNLTQIR